MGGVILMFPREKRIVTPGSIGLSVMLQVRIAWADRVDVGEGEKVSVNEVLLSTSVMWDLSIAALMLEGGVWLFEGLS